MHIKNNLNEIDLIQQIGNNAVRNAQKNSLDNGIPNVYSKNGSIYYQLSDGSITMESPFETTDLKERFEVLIQKIHS